MVKRLFKYLVLATCVLLLRVMHSITLSIRTTPLFSRIKTLWSEPPSFSVQDFPAEEEAELEQDGLYEAPCVV